jgi:uncharacterized integral membrane protein
LLSHHCSMYRTSMRYLKIAFVILMLFVVMVFCVNNIDEFSLSFLGYPLTDHTQLWMLLAIFFIAGMVPIFIIELPRSIAHFSRMRSLKAQMRQLESRLDKNVQLPGDPKK